MKLIDHPFDNWHKSPSHNFSPLVSTHRVSVFSPTQRFRSLEKYLPRDVDGRPSSELENWGFNHGFN